MTSSKIPLEHRLHTHLHNTTHNNVSNTTHTSNTQTLATHPPPPRHDPTKHPSHHPTHPPKPQSSLQHYPMSPLPAGQISLSAMVPATQDI
jgi:hypothetical protein